MRTEDSKLIAFLITTAILMALLVAFIITMLYLYTKRQRRHREDLARIQNDFDKSLLNVQLEMQEQTLQHIGREIHDSITMNLTLAKLRLNTLPPGLAAEVTEKVQAAVELVGNSIDDLAALSKGLNSNYVEANGLLLAIEQELKKVKKAGDYEVDYQHSGEAVFLSGQREVLLFRIVQEALQNIVKHAGARHIAVRLNYGPQTLQVEVQDDGRGPQIHKGRGQGLKNMQLRAINAGGRAELLPVPAGGALVRVEVPVEY